jgi:type I restriction enzyme S subunit
MFGTYPKNENGFPVAVISDVANVSVGVVIKPAQYYVTEECGIKAFRSLNIGEMYIKDSDWVYFSTEGNESNKKSQLHENDLLIVRSGAPGTSCVVTKEFEGCNAVDVIIAHPNLSKVNPWYLCAYINYPHGKKQIEEGTGGAAQQHFNVGKCNNLKVLLPPLEPQNQFAAFVERVNQQKQTVQQSLEKLELMKKALMQEYFG